jgi:hypothetical protein
MSISLTFHNANTSTCTKLNMDMLPFRQGRIELVLECAYRDEEGHFILAKS